MTVDDQIRAIFHGPIVVAVSGGRDYTDDSTIYSALSLIHRAVGIKLLIEGACPVGDGGADERARRWALFNEVNSLSCPAKAKTYGWPRAGPLRNQEMATFSPSLWVFFPGGKGTASARGIAIHQHIAYCDVSSDGSARIVRP